MPAVVVVAGPEDEQIVRALLPPAVAEGVAVVVAGLRGSPPSTASTLLVTRRQPVALVLDAKTIDPRFAREIARDNEEVLKYVAGKIPVKVVAFLPTIEIIFFEAAPVLERVLGVPIPGELLAEARGAPKDALAKLLASHPQVKDIPGLLARLTEEDREALRATTGIAALIDFLSRYSSAVTV